jgi:hypothetical protein
MKEQGMWKNIEGIAEVEINSQLDLVKGLKG